MTTLLSDHNFYKQFIGVTLNEVVTERINKLEVYIDKGWVWDARDSEWQENFKHN